MTRSNHRTAVRFNQCVTFGEDDDVVAVRGRYLASARVPTPMTIKGLPPLGVLSRPAYPRECGLEVPTG
jgi:hypothetical protein